MTQVVFHNVMMLALLSALPFLAVLYLYADHRRKKALKRFVAAMMLPQLTDCPTDRRRRWKAIALCGAFVFVVIALSRPAWNPTETQLARAGRDIVFVLDVSRSMLAEDLAPNRLDRAKRAILDCLEDLKGDRVGLVAFAGSASIISPLTHDYQFFRSVLTDVTCDSVTVGGTRIGDAILKVADDMLADTKAGYQDIILITDGEDHDSKPTAAAEELKLKGARLIAIGLGDEYQGRRIPVTDDETGQTSFMKHENQEVWSRMPPTALRHLISVVPESVLLKVGTGTIDLAGIYQQLIVTARNRQYEGETNIRYEEKFQIFVAIAILLLLLRAPMGQRTCHENTRQPDDTSEGTQAASPPKTAAAYLLALLMVIASTAGAASTKELITAGNAAYAAGDYTGAVESYDQALYEEPESAMVIFNLGSALYKTGDYESASAAFQEATFVTEDPSLAAKCWYNLGNCLYRQVEMQMRYAEETEFMPEQANDNLKMAMWLCRQSIGCYRGALDLDPALNDAAHNIEVLCQKTMAIAEDMANLQQLQRQIAKALDDIRKKLLELIQRQQAAAESSRKIAVPAAATEQLLESQTSKLEFSGLVTTQQGINDDTGRLEEDMSKLSSQMPVFSESGEHGEPAIGISPMETSLRHVSLARLAQAGAVDNLKRSIAATAAQAQDRAAAELQLALEALPATQNSGEGEGEEGDSEGEGEYEESDEEGDAESDQSDSFEPADEEMDMTGLPDPSQTPEDILEEELANKQQRSKKRSGEYKAGQKDW